MGGDKCERRVVEALLVLVWGVGLVVGCSREKQETLGRQASVTVSRSEAPRESATAISTMDTQRSTPVATPTLTPNQAVLDAYQRYWDVYSAALLELDANLIHTVATGEEQERIRQEIDMLRSKGVALRVRVERHPLIIEVNDTTAVIYDEVTNQSFYVDAITKQPPQGTGSGEILRDTYYLRKMDGMWKVVRST